MNWPKRIGRLLLLFLIMGGSCDSKPISTDYTKEQMDKNTPCSWSPCLSSPFYFTTAVEWFYVRYGKNSAAGLSGIDNFLFNNGMTISSPIECTVNNLTPSGVDIIWASWMERKWYAAAIDFTNEEKEKIKNALNSTFASYDDEDISDIKPKEGQYDIFHVCCFPGGKLRYFLESSDYNRIISLDITSQAAETHKLDESYLHGGRCMIKREEKYWENMDDYFDEMTLDGKYKKELDDIEEEYDEETRERIEYYREHGAPDPALWDPYFVRYNYNVSIVMEDSASQLRKESCFFTNAELYERYPTVNPGNIITRPSALKKLVFEWNSKGFIYSCYIYFNEEETFRLFQEAFGNNPDAKGELKVFVSKYNNYLELSLTVGEKTYAFEKMQIDIGRRERYYDETDRVYENYEGEHQDFVGR